MCFAAKINRIFMSLTLSKKNDCLLKEEALLMLLENRDLLNGRNTSLANNHEFICS